VFRERVKEPRRKCTAFNKQGPAFLPSVIREIHFRIRTAPRELLIEPAEHGTLKPFCRTILVFQLSHHRAMRILSVVPNGHTCKLIIDRNESKRLNRYAAKPGRPFHQLIMLLPPHRLHVAKVGPLRERLSPFYPLQPLDRSSSRHPKQAGWRDQPRAPASYRRHPTKLLVQPWTSVLGDRGSCIKLHWFRMLRLAFVGPQVVNPSE
jgi:hypothetical protein